MTEEGTVPAEVPEGPAASRPAPAGPPPAGQPLGPAPAGPPPAWQPPRPAPAGPPPAGPPPAGQPPRPAPAGPPPRPAPAGPPPAGQPSRPALAGPPPAGQPPAGQPPEPAEEPPAGPPPEPEPIEPSRYLQYLPAIYHDSDFMGRFLHLPEELIDPVEDVLNEIAHYFDPRMAPASFLSWLASWIDLVLDENWPEGRRRELIHQGTELYRWRGTRRGLITYLRIYAGVEPEIVEQLAAKDGGPFRFTVVLKVKDAAAVDEVRVRSIIEAEKPAHTSYTLRIEGAGSRKPA